MSSKQFNVAIIGLGFGAEFIPIYQRHPQANMYAICQRTEDSLNEIGDKYKIETRYQNYDDVLNDPNVDFVHINTPIPNHAEQSIAALKAGKHVACTVPMATSVEDCETIVNLCKETGLKYMMMETVVYAREFLFAKEMYENGELKKILEEMFITKHKKKVKLVHSASKSIRPIFNLLQTGTSGMLLLF